MLLGRAQEVEGGEPVAKATTSTNRQHQTPGEGLWKELWVASAVSSALRGNKEMTQVFCSLSPQPQPATLWTFLWGPPTSTL